MTEEKFNKSEVSSLLPDQSKVDKNILKICGDEISKINDSLKKQLEKWDERMIELRKEFDMPKIDKLIKSKLPKEEFDS